MSDETDFRDAISHLIMAEPVVLAGAGDTFEKELIEVWFKDHNTNPLTNEVLTNKTLTPNRVLNGMIQTYLSKHPELYEKDEVYLPKRILNEFFDDIKNNRLDKIKSKWLKYSDYRIFYKPNEEFRNYSAFHFATEFSSESASTMCLYKHIIEKKFFNKIIENVALNWNPINLPSMISSILNEDCQNKKLYFENVLKFHSYADNVQKDYLVKILHQQIKLGNIEQIKWIVNLDQKIIHKRDDMGNTSILLAFESNKESIIKYLLECNADLKDSNEQHENCFYFACRNSNLSLLSHFSEFSLFKPVKKLPVLHMALYLYHNDFKLLEKIIELNKDFLNEFDENKKTPLFVVCEIALKYNGEWIELVDFLLKKGADSSILCSSNQESAIHLVGLESNTNLILKFIKHDCELNILDINNENVLHKAIRVGNKELVDVLLNAGLDYNLRNKDGLTPIDLATIDVKNQIYQKISQMKKNEKKLIKELQNEVEQFKSIIKNQNDEISSLKGTIENLVKDLNNRLPLGTPITGSAAAMEFFLRSMHNKKK